MEGCFGSAGFKFLFEPSLDLKSPTQSGVVLPGGYPPKYSLPGKLKLKEFWSTFLESKLPSEFEFEMGVGPTAEPGITLLALSSPVESPTTVP